MSADCSTDLVERLFDQCYRIRSIVDCIIISLAKFGFSISQAAASIGVQPQQLRYWEEKITLFNPVRANTHRTYSRQQIEIGKAIKKMLDQGSTLAKIENYINANYNEQAEVMPVTVEIPVQTKQLLTEIKQLRQMIANTIKIIDENLPK